MGTLLWTLRSGARTYWTLKIQGWMQRRMRFPTWCEINESGGFWRLENTLLSLQVAPQVGRDSKASLSNQLSLLFSVFLLLPPSCWAADCQNALGLASGHIADSQITASGQYGE